MASKLDFHRSSHFRAIWAGGHLEFSRWCHAKTINVDISGSNSPTAAL